MEQLAEKLSETTNDENWYSPQTLAWKLIMDDFTEDDNLANMIMSYNPDHTSENDPASFLFEILLTIFMEMLFDFAIIMSAKECETNGREFEFKPNMKKFNIDDYTELIQNKFLKVSILLTIEKHDIESFEKDYLEKIINKRYCKVIVKPNRTESHLFKLYKVDSDANYHMILNSSYEKTDVLKDIYAICKINNTLYQISFNIIEKIKPSF